MTSSAEIHSTEEETTDKKMRFIVRMTCVTLLCTCLICWRLYIPGFRILARVPVIPLLAATPSWVDYLVMTADLSSLLWLIWKPGGRAAMISVLLSEVFWVLEDVTHLAPYVYMYFYVIFVAAFRQPAKSNGLDALRIMVSGVYFWAGFHKLNLTFFTYVFPWFIEPIHVFSHATPPSTLDLLFFVLMLHIPYFESLIGVLLWFPRLQPLASAMAFAMLMTVLVCLGPWGHNWGMVVWPWNVYLFVLELWLFMRRGIMGGSKTIALLFDWRNIISISLFIVMPCAAMFSQWYAMPGFKLYSGNIIMSQIVFSPKETLARAPEYIRELTKPGHRLDVTKWGEREGGLVYPVDYAQRTATKAICPYLDEPVQAELRIYLPPPFYSTHRESEEWPLCPQSTETIY